MIQDRNCYSFLSYEHSSNISIGGRICCVSLCRLVNRVAIEATYRALTVFPLANVYMLGLTGAPDHLAFLTVWTRVPHSIAEQASVLTLVVRPNVCAFAVTNVVLESAGEGALVVVVFDAPLAVQTTILVPSAFIRAGTDLDYAVTDELALAWLVIGRSR